MTLADGYRAIQQHAAIGAVAPRLQIAVAGQDRAAYLQGLLTNDIQALTPGTGCYSAWLSPQGRMLTDMHVLESGGMILLDVPAETLGVHDPAPRAVHLYRGRPRGFAGGEPGQRMAAWPASRVGARAGDRRRTRSERVARVSPHAIRVRRFSRLRCSHQPTRCSGILCLPRTCASGGSCVRPRRRRCRRRVPKRPSPRRGSKPGIRSLALDMTEDTIPLEAGIESRAISFTKGCYVGQEVIIRVLHRGHGRVAKKLVFIRIDGQRPERGAKALRRRAEIGVVTSAADSPRSGTIALGYVHRDFLTPGTGVAGRNRCPRRARGCRHRDSCSINCLISSASAGGKSSVSELGLGAPIASAGPAAGRGVPRSVHR